MTDPHLETVAEELVACRLESPTAARAALDAAVGLVESMPVDMAVEPSVFAGLQHLVCAGEAAIVAVERRRHQQVTQASGWR